MSKFWFFDRKGRPTTNEKRICDKFNSLIDEGQVSNNQVEEYLEEYGKPMNDSELEEMFGYLTGEDSQGNKYEYADGDDSDDLVDDADYDDNEFEQVDNSQQASNNSIDFNPFEEPVVERPYTKGFAPKSQGEDDDSDSDDDDDDAEGFSDEELKMPKDGESIDDLEDEDIPEPKWANTGGFVGGDDDDDDDDDRSKSVV